MFLCQLCCVDRYAYPWWKEKIIDSDVKRKDGLCPLSPEETALTLRALDINQDIQIYIAAGEIYGGGRRMADLSVAYPKVVSIKFQANCFLSLPVHLCITLTGS